MTLAEDTRLRNLLEKCKETLPNFSFADCENVAFGPYGDRDIAIAIRLVCESLLGGEDK